MKQQLTKKEIEKIQNLCFESTERACAIAQTIIDTCQVVSCSTYAKIKHKNKRTVLYKALKIPGITIENRKFVSPAMYRHPIPFVEMNNYPGWSQNTGW